MTMALDVDECDQIIEAARRAGVQLTVAKQSRHFEMSMRAKEYLDEGRIGELLFIRPVSVTPGHGFKNVPQSWPMLASEGDAFLDWGSHACDALRWLTGADAKRVYADYDDFTGAPIQNSTALVQIRMTNRVIAQALGCSERTVELHIASLFRKASCESRTALVAKFWRSRG